MTPGSEPIHDRSTALAFLFGRIDYERARTVPYRSSQFKLDRMRQLAARLGAPEKAFPAVHIAGTKGKGSTASMIAASLSAAGYRTGLYTSPHLLRLEERFVVDGAMCSEEELVGLLAEIQPIVWQMDAEVAANRQLQGPTYFEITTAAALLHFRRLGVQCAVLEVGLGGRLDSTNICHPVVSVITTISFDHTRQLGKTLTAIAGEKAGIIKPATTVVTGVEQREPWQVIERVARDQHAPVLAVGREFGFDQVVPGRDGEPPMAELPAGTELGHGNALNYRETIDGQRYELSHVSLGMLGRHQAANGAVALATLRHLRRSGWEIDESALRSGLARTRCPARFELVRHHPRVILDAAHNPASVAALVAALGENYPTGPRLLIFAVSVDKDVPQMLLQLLPHFPQVVVTRFLNNPRAMEPESVARLAQKLMSSHADLNVQLHVCPDPRSAWQWAQSLLTPEHVVCVAGSFFLAAEIRPHLENACQEAAGSNTPFR